MVTHLYGATYLEIGRGLVWLDRFDQWLTLCYQQIEFYLALCKTSSNTGDWWPGISHWHLQLRLLLQWWCLCLTSCWGSSGSLPQICWLEWCSQLGNDTLHDAGYKGRLYISQTQFWALMRSGWAWYPPVIADILVLLDDRTTLRRVGLSGNWLYNNIRMGRRCYTENLLALTMQHSHSATQYRYALL